MTVQRREGCTYVCEVPKEFGAVTKIEMKRGKVIARTESGHTMILPTSRPVALEQGAAPSGQTGPLSP